MADERNLFERLDSIEEANESTNKMLAQIVGIVQNQKPVASQPQPQQQKQSDEEIVKQFLKKSKKSWRWFGNKAEFNKQKILAIASLLILLIVGLATSIISTICFKIYSTFTLFENIWMIFAIVYLVFAFKSQLTYEVNALVANSPIKYETDQVGMKFPKKEKLVFRLFKWLAIISVVCNVVCIWIGMGKSNQILATIMEVLFLGTIIFSLIMNSDLFRGYLMVRVEGYNLNTKEKIVLVLPPGAKEFIEEEEYRKKIPFLFE